MTLINEEFLCKYLASQLNDEIKCEVEPYIQQCLRNIEKTIRRTVASHIIGLIETNVDFEVGQKNIRITIEQPVCEDEK